MFSKGTFQRYLFEIDSRQQKMLDLYTKLAAQTTEPASGRRWSASRRLVCPWYPAMDARRLRRRQPWRITIP